MEIAKTLESATAALDFEVPLESGDKRYVDFGEARGANVLTRLRKLLEREPQDQWFHGVFASHRGAGKSTELKRLAHQVREQYFAVYFEANVEMDAVKLSMEDLLLVIARVIEEKMRLRNTPINNDALSRVEKWFSEVVFTDEQGKSFLGGVKTEANAEGGIPFVAKLLASVTASFKVESSHRESMKNTLKKFPGTLMTLVNNLLDAAAEILAKEKKRLLLLIDNMDRYEPTVIDDLLVKSAERFKALRCNVILTPPIGLVLKAESQNLDSVFRCETMPTVKLRESTQGYWEFTGTGRDVLLEALGKRIDLQGLIPEQEAQNRLVAASSGAIRELLEMTQDVTLDANGEKITLADVNLMLNRRRNRLRDRIDANGWWDVLNQIAESKRLDKSPEFLEVVYQRLAFQYNGEIWYDVQPLISDLLTARKNTQSPKSKVKKR